MKGHALVGERVEGEPAKLVAGGYLELRAGVVLELRAGLTGNVHRHERQHVRAEPGEHLIGSYAARSHEVDDSGDDERVGEGEEEDVAEGDRDVCRKEPPLLAGDLPVAGERSRCGRAPWLCAPACGDCGHGESLSVLVCALLGYPISDAASLVK